MTAETKSTLRQERAEIVQALRGEGLKYREIATRTGLSNSYVAELATDPTGERTAARKASYVKPCRRCGNPAPGTGSDGRNTPPSLCQACSYDERRYWTRERIVEWIQAYVAEHGKVPSASLLITSAVGMGPRTVRREFGDGGWRDAVRAAGFTPLNDYEGRGGPLYREHPLIQERLRLHGEGVSLAEIARRQGVSRNAIDHTICRYAKGKPMGSRLSPTAVLEREKERSEHRVTALRAELEAEERNVEGLTAALEALSAAHQNGTGKTP